MMERQRRGVISVIRSTTSWSCVKAYPHTLRKENRIPLARRNSAAARVKTAYIETLAAFGFPAPNSFEIRMLQNSYEVI